MFILMLFSEPLQQVDKYQKQPPQLFYEKGVPRNSTKFTRKHLCLSPFFNKFAGLRPGHTVKVGPRIRCNPGPRTLG